MLRSHDHGCGANKNQLQASGGFAVEEERRRGAAAASSAAAAAKAELAQVQEAVGHQLEAAVAAAKEEAHEAYMASHAVPVVEEVARRLPDEERGNALCIIASCLAPQWQLATLAAGIEVRSACK
jgi:hypothetical protein